MVEVKYLGVVVGYTYDNKTIAFYDNEEAKQCKKDILDGQSIFISSRKLGVVKENNFVDEEEIVEYCITKCNEM